MAFLQDPLPFRDAPRDLKTAVECLRPRWGWIVALGALIAGMGVAALILAGAAEIATSLSAKTQDMGPVFALDHCQAFLYRHRRRGLRTCSAFGRGGLFTLVPQGPHEDVPRNAAR